MLLFLVEHYRIRRDIIYHYLILFDIINILQNSNNDKIIDILWAKLVLILLSLFINNG